MMGKTAVLSPFTGSVLRIEDVPDPVFAEKMLGDGVAVQPTQGLACAPIDGRISVLHSSGHAFAVQAEGDSLGVLVHIGLDTVKMKGQGFTLHARVGDQVKAGQPVVEFDLAAISAAGFSALSPVILPDLPPQARIERNALTDVTAGTSILLTVTIP